MAIPAGIALLLGYEQQMLLITGGFFIIMVSGGATMVAKQGMNPVEVGGWALLGAATATVIGMLPALWGLHRPEITAVERLEKAVASYAADPRPHGCPHPPGRDVAGHDLVHPLRRRPCPWRGEHLPSRSL